MLHWHKNKFQNEGVDPAAESIKHEQDMLQICIYMYTKLVGLKDIPWFNTLI